MQRESMKESASWQRGQRSLLKAPLTLTGMGGQETLEDEALTWARDSFASASICREGKEGQEVGSAEIHGACLGFGQPKA